MSVEIVLIIIVWWSVYQLRKAIDRLFNRIADLEDRLERHGFSDE